jgi:CheY-like chemotaxis protein
MKTNKLKILIAEDEEFADTYLTIVLKEIGSEIYHAKTGAEAVNIFSNNTDIDLVLMDISMPIMNGYTATEEIRKISKTVKIIAQTAYAMEGDREKAIMAGCNNYISKPINRNKLLEIIDSLTFNR